MHSPAERINIKTKRSSEAIKATVRLAEPINRVKLIPRSARRQTKAAELKSETRVGGAKGSRYRLRRRQQTFRERKAAGL